MEWATPLYVKLADIYMLRKVDESVRFVALGSHMQHVLLLVGLHEYVCLQILD